MSQDRRNDYDVTNTVQVSDPVAVRNAVYALYSETFPGASYDKIWLAFYDFEPCLPGATRAIAAAIRPTMTCSTRST